ncbi:unnamed protein product, partial [Amoebophrya sp. A25]
PAFADLDQHAAWEGVHQKSLNTTEPSIQLSSKNGDSATATGPPAAGAPLGRPATATASAGVVPGATLTPLGRPASAAVVPGGAVVLPKKKKLKRKSPAVFQAPPEQDEFSDCYYHVSSRPRAGPGSPAAATKRSVRQSIALTRPKTAQQKSAYERPKLTQEDNGAGLFLEVREESYDEPTGGLRQSNDHSAEELRRKDRVIRENKREHHGAGRRANASGSAGENGASSKMGDFFFMRKKGKKTDGGEHGQAGYHREQTLGSVFRNEDEPTREEYDEEVIEHSDAWYPDDRTKNFNPRRDIEREREDGEVVDLGEDEDEIEDGPPPPPPVVQEPEIEDISQFHRGDSAFGFMDAEPRKKDKPAMDINKIMMRSKVVTASAMDTDNVQDMARSKLERTMEDVPKAKNAPAKRSNGGFLVPLEDQDPESVAARWNPPRYMRHLVTKTRREFAGIEKLEEVSNDELLSQLMLMGSGEDADREEVGPQYSDFAGVSHWTYRAPFNHFMLVIISISIIVVGIEADMVASKGKEVMDPLLSQRIIFYALENLTVLIFIGEFSCRIRALGLQYFDDQKWMFCALLMNVIDIYQGLYAYSGLLKMGFLIRFKRFFSLKEMFYYFPTLKVHMRSYFFVRKAAQIASTVQWCALLTILFANIMSIFHTDIIKKAHVDLYESMKTTGFAYRKWFGVSLNTFQSLMMIIVWDKGVMDGTIRPIIQRIPFLMYTFFLIYAFGTMGILKVLGGSIVSHAVYGLDTNKKVAYEKDIKNRQAEVMTLSQDFQKAIIDPEIGLADVEKVQRILH